MTAWTDFVKKTYDAGHAKDSNYKLKDAMRDASKTYKKQKSAAAPAAVEATADAAVPADKKSRKSRKSRKSKKKKCTLVCKGGKRKKSRRARK
uniref:Uncharacterized protein n=1 Tax=viral metagenome TaxID=1070528 RepID=A0A6C0HWU7_9ZZZZ